MIVVKLGGSLFDHPNLREGLNSWLEMQKTQIVLVPGGGTFTDGVREFDRIHGYGEELAHWASLHALDVTSFLIRTIIKCQNVHMMPLLMFFRQHDHLPHSWDVTSDSIAAHIASMQKADKLILLKSQDRPDGSWESLAERGFIDRYFPKIAERIPFPIEVLNFRRWLDDGSSA